MLAEAGKKEPEAGLAALAEALTLVDGRHGGTLVGRGAVSLQRGAAPEATRSRRARGGRLFAPGARYRSPSGGKVTGIAGGHEPGAPVAAARQAGRSLCPAGADLRLVYRGL